VSAGVDVDDRVVSEENHAALWRKLKKPEELSPKDKKALMDYIDLLMIRSANKK
jgi:hypothetical protein